MTEKTGRQLDAEIAQKIFGHTVIWVDDHRGVGHPYLLASELNGADYVRDYSTDMCAAWLVAEKIQERTGVFTLAWMPVLAQWGCVYHEAAGGREMGMADTAPEAICLAALELFGGNGD